MSSKKYIVVESSENDDDMPVKNTHTENEAASLRTMHDHGVAVEKQTIQPEETILNEASTLKFLSQNGIEILPEPHEQERESALPQI